MRNLSSAFDAHLKSGATTVCRCWKIVRKDETVLGFCDHDNDLSFDNVTFEAGSGLDATALQTANGLSVDNTEASGALSSDGIRESDIAAGKFDGADVYIWIVNWQNPTERYMIFRGYIGEITYGKNAFTAELRGLTEKLNSRIGRSYLKQCTALLGDKACQVDLTKPNFRIETKVKRSESQLTIFLDNMSGFETDWFTFGTLEFKSGKNSGSVFSIVSDKTVNSERKLVLSDEPYFTIDEGDDVELIVGCNKASDTCRLKFQNMVNFQGFPSIPGEDWMMAYPKPKTGY